MKPGLVFAVLLASEVALSEPLHFGLKGGLPFGEFFAAGGDGNRLCGCFTNFTSKPVRYTVGPSLELPGPFHIAFEFDALYKRFHYDVAGAVGFVPRTEFAGRTTGNSWEFPLLIKYRPMRRVYIAGGPVIRYLRGLHQIRNEVVREFNGDLRIQRIEAAELRELRKRWFPGVAAGAGFDLPAAFLRVSPELRYTRWTANASGGYPPLQFEGNQVELLFGVSF